MRFLTKRRLAFGIAAAVVAAGASSAAFPTRQAFTATEVETGRLAFAASVEAGDPFEIAFVHSVHRTPVQEFYRVGEDGALVLEKVVYETYGVGNPSAPEPGQRFRNEDGKMIIEGMNRRLPALNQRIGQLVADHRLVWKGRSIPFASFSEPGSLVRLKVERISLWALWRGGAGLDRN